MVSISIPSVPRKSTSDMPGAACKKYITGCFLRVGFFGVQDYGDNEKDVFQYGKDIGEYPVFGDFLIFVFNDQLVGKNVNKE